MPRLMILHIFLNDFDPLRSLEHLPFENRCSEAIWQNVLYGKVASMRTVSRGNLIAFRDVINHEGSASAGRFARRLWPALPIGVTTTANACTSA